MFGQRSTVVYADEDENWVDGQTQIEGETREPPIKSSKPRMSKPVTNDHSVGSMSTSRDRPDVPAAVWEAKRPPSASISRANLLPLMPRNPNGPRRFLNPDGSPIRYCTGGLTGENDHFSTSQDEKHSGASESKRMTPLTADEALEQLYAGEAGEGGPDLGESDDSAGDFMALEDFSGFNRYRVPSTEAGSDDSGTDSDSAKGQSKSRDQDVSRDSEERDSHSSDVDEQSKLDRKRQRILSRVMPAVMIKKGLQKERLACLSFFFFPLC